MKKTPEQLEREFQKYLEAHKAHGTVYLYWSSGWGVLYDAGRQKQIYRFVLSAAGVDNRKPNAPTLDRVFSDPLLRATIWAKACEENT